MKSPKAYFGWLPVGMENLSIIKNQQYKDMKDLSIIKETMSSIEIAELTGKEHKNVMAAIRTMEPSWEKVAGLKFKLSEYKDSTGRTLPMYELSKLECLYIATKFNVEARAKLIIRWEQLETEKLQSHQDKQPLTSAEIILQMAQLGVAHEQRIAKVEQGYAQIMEDREQAVFDLDYLPVADTPTRISYFREIQNRNGCKEQGLCLYTISLRFRRMDRV